MSGPEGSLEERIEQAQAALDTHVRRIVAHHFSPATGTPYWLEFASRARFSPLDDIQCAADLALFGHFDEEALRQQPHAAWVPAALEDQPFSVFETGGTTGLPKSRLSWRDHQIDYTAYSELLCDEAFPRGAAWLMLGPSGPRRLRLAIEHLAQVRGGHCYFVDLDPRWVKKELAQGRDDTATRYTEHVIDQAVSILKHREVGCLFSTPRLLEALSLRLNVPDCGIRGVMCGGTSLSPQTVRFLNEEVLGHRARLEVVYGNTLMGLAPAELPTAQNDYAITYYAPQPRALLRVVDEDGALVSMGERGRVELTTLTEELFMPRLLERDEATRCPPCPAYPWDGTGDVRPLPRAGAATIEGVY